jgi:hypothetical protein
MPDGAVLIRGGEVYTVDPARPSAAAVAARDGKILAVGTEDECRRALGPGHDQIDLRGSCLLPGFIDTHLHPLLLMYFDMNADLKSAGSIAGIKEMLREAAAGRAPGQWAVGLNFDEQSLTEKRLPGRRDLDEAAPDRPALIIKHDGHMVIGNSRALLAAGISASTVDPAGGVIDREPDGAPAGPLRENAAGLLLNAMPMPDPESLLAGAKAAFAKLAAGGITSIGGVLQTGGEGPAGSSGSFDLFAMAALLPQLPLNFYGLLITRDPAQIAQARKSPLHRDTWANRRVGAVKIYADGTFGSCTAFMREPFSDQPDKRGFMTMDRDELYRIMTESHKAGLQIAIHAIGDAANRACIDLYERLLQEHPRPDHRHRLEHASILDQEMIADMARLGLAVSTQPLFIHSEKHWLHQRLGPARARWTYPFRSLLDGGVRVAGASDAPVESVDVLHAIQCCVTREGFETGQAVTAAEAVRMFTLDAAFAQFEDSIKGSISPGKRADLVILSKNPVSTPPEKIRDIRVERTICGGKTVHLQSP